MSVDPERRDDYTSIDVVLRRRVYIFNQSKHGVVVAAYSEDVIVIRLVITLTTLRHGYCVRSGDGGAGRGRGGGGGWRGRGGDRQVSKRGHVNSLFACTPILLLSRVQDIITMSVDPKRRDDYTSTDVVLRRRVYIFNQSKHGVVLAAYSADVIVIRLVITLTTLRHGYCG